MRIYVGHLNRDVTDLDLRQSFEAFGRVESASVTKNKWSGESKGFGFVEMPENVQAQAAIKDLNGKVLKGQALIVK